MKKMKRMIAGVLAAAMVAGMSFSALAAATDSDQTAVTYNDEGEVTITKNYEAANKSDMHESGEIVNESPAERFEFTIEAGSVTDAASVVNQDNMPIPAVTGIEYEKGDAGKANDKTKIMTVTLPELSDLETAKKDDNGRYVQYPSVGVYTYIIKETAEHTAGVSYFDDEITLVVTVIQDADENGDPERLRIAAVHCETPVDKNHEGGTKTDKFENVYSAGSLSVKKEVTGNLGDEQQDFTVKVAFTAPAGKIVKSDIFYTDGDEAKVIEAGDGWTGTTEPVEITLKHDETVMFTNIPYGITYSVTEDDYTSEGYDKAVYSYTGKVYTTVNDERVTNVVKIEESEEIGNEAAYSLENMPVDLRADCYIHEVKITNNRSTAVDTGISLDSLPYILLLAAAVTGLFAAAAKKRDRDLF